MLKDYRVKNDAGLLRARKGVYNGKEHVFTHRDPKSGQVWGEDIAVWSMAGIVFGKWVNPEEVKWLTA